MNLKNMMMTFIISTWDSSTKGIGKYLDPRIFFLVTLIEVPEIDEIYNECDDPDLADEKIDGVIEEIYHNPLYFIERNGYDMVINDINF